jgi:osmoprotectant transport system permease protein
VESKTGLGGTQICFEALVKGQIDLYPEYTGTALLTILRPRPGEAERLAANRDSVYRYVQQHFETQYDLEWLDPIGFNNAYALMMLRAEAQRLKIHTISDLVDYLKKDKL